MCQNTLGKRKRSEFFILCHIGLCVCSYYELGINYCIHLLYFLFGMYKSTISNL